CDCGVSDFVETHRTRGSIGKCEGLTMKGCIENFIRNTLVHEKPKFFSRQEKLPVSLFLWYK
ncbi:MAG: hypothetical protein J5986_03170, partial [Roseburia sp.]|nr:hypothetical protein [Roseburia sp.]